MNDIAFNTGVKTFSLNGKCEVSFNPTDSAFVQKIYSAFDSLDKKQDEYKAEAVKLPDEAGAEFFRFTDKMNNEMRETIDCALGGPVCDALFGDMNVYAYADGLPVWCNLMLAVINEIDKATASEKKASSARIKKYTAKYHK